MASASSSSARLLFNDSKKRLADRINVNTKNAASVAKQIVLGSKSTEMLMQTSKQLAQLESTMDNTMQSLTKMELIRQHMGYQYDGISENSAKLATVAEQIHAMER